VDDFCRGSEYLQAKVVDDDGKEVGFGKEGEALIRGSNIFERYYPFYGQPTTFIFTP
jgi:non-ribosomal peptide synthetase component E (peptide arylation enzyme)